MPNLPDAVAAFVRARLSPGESTGLYLTIGVLLFIAMAWIFGSIAENVANSNGITLIDDQVAHWFHAHANPALTTWMLLITHIHGNLGVMLLSLAAGIWLAYKEERYWLYAVTVTVPGGLLMNVLVKHVFQRARPSFEDPLLTLATYSFPSGHTVGATLFYGVLAAYWYRRMSHSWRSRTLTVLVAVSMVSLVGISRLYLGVHYLSDILGAVAEGIAWIALCLTGISHLRRREEARRLGDA